MLGTLVLVYVTLLPYTQALAGLTDDKEQLQAFLHYCHALKSVTQVRPAALLCASCFCIVLVQSIHCAAVVLHVSIAYTMKI